MNVAHIETKSFIYGPGCRFVIWVQGCKIHCKGCWNSQMWSFATNNSYSVLQLLEMINRERSSIEGVTLLGGEPLDQYEETYKLCSECQRSGFSTMIFTGYELSEIEHSTRATIKDVADILIVGRYEETLRTTEKQWIGSTNQQILFLTDRYMDYKLYDTNYMEINIEESGKCTILGFPDEKECIDLFH